MSEVSWSTTSRSSSTSSPGTSSTTAIASSRPRPATRRERDRGSQPDLVLLDVMLPGETDGLALCRWIRSMSELPVILLTARGEESDRIVGLELGADDYVTKPFSPRELATRVRRSAAGASEHRAAHVRRGRAARDRRGEARSAARRRAAPAHRGASSSCCWFLASNPNRVFSRDQLMHRVWGYSSALDTGTVTVHMRRRARRSSAIRRIPRCSRPCGASATGCAHETPADASRAARRARARGRLLPLAPCSRPAG